MFRSAFNPNVYSLNWHFITSITDRFRISSHGWLHSGTSSPIYIPSILSIFCNYCNKGRVYCPAVGYCPRAEFKKRVHSEYPSKYIHFRVFSCKLHFYIPPHQPDPNTIIFCIPMFFVISISIHTALFFKSFVYAIYFFFIRAIRKFAYQFHITSRFDFYCCLRIATVLSLNSNGKNECEVICVIFPRDRVKNILSSYIHGRSIVFLSIYALYFTRFFLILNFIPY